MAAYDEKLLNGAGVAKLSQLIKTAIEQGSSAEIYVGSSTPSTSSYKVWIDTSGTADTVVQGVSVNGSNVVLDNNNVANIGYTVYQTTTDNTNLTWNKQVLRAGTDTTAISCVQPTATTYSQEICGFFLADGTSCDFTVANANIIYEDDSTSQAGAALSVEVEDGKVYEFSLMAMSTTSTVLLLKEVG